MYVPLFQIIIGVTFNKLFLYKLTHTDVTKLYLYKVPRITVENLIRK